MLRLIMHEEADGGDNAYTTLEEACKREAAAAWRAFPGVSRQQSSHDECVPVSVDNIGGGLRE